MVWFARERCQTDRITTMKYKSGPKLVVAIGIFDPNSTLTLRQIKAARDHSKVGGSVESPLGEVVESPCNALTDYLTETFGDLAAVTETIDWANMTTFLAHRLKVGPDSERAMRVQGSNAPRPVKAIYENLDFLVVPPNVMSWREAALLRITAGTTVIVYDHDGTHHTQHLDVCTSYSLLTGGGEYFYANSPDRVEMHIRNELDRFYPDRIPVDLIALRKQIEGGRPLREITLAEAGVSSRVVNSMRKGLIGPFGYAHQSLPPLETLAGLTSLLEVELAENIKGIANAGIAELKQLLQDLGLGFKQPYASLTGIDLAQVRLTEIGITPLQRSLLERMGFSNLQAVVDYLPQLPTDQELGEEQMSLMRGVIVRLKELDLKLED